MKDTYWFRHDANARCDKSMLRLRARFGLEGIGWYWCVIEMLREESDYKLPLSSVDGLAMSINLTTDRFNELLGAAVELNLLTNDGHYFYSPSLTRRMDRWDLKRKILSANAKQKLSKCKANDEQSLLILSNLILDENELPEEILVQPPEVPPRGPSVTKTPLYQTPDARGNERKPLTKFPKIWLSELEINSLEKRFEKVGLRKEFWDQAYANLEQWFTDTSKGRNEYPKSSNHMRRIANWGLTTALKLQRESDYAKQATARLK